MARSPAPSNKPSARTSLTKRKARAPRHPRRGEIWFVYTPGQPDDPHQPRPALVISEDVRNRMRDDLIVVPLFSLGRLGPTRIHLTAGMGGLLQDSVLFCEEITTIDRDFLARGPLGPAVSSSKLAEAIRAVRRAVGETVVEP